MASRLSTFASYLLLFLTVSGRALSLPNSIPFLSRARTATVLPDSNNTIIIVFACFGSLLILLLGIGCLCAFKRHNNEASQHLHYFDPITGRQTSIYDQATGRILKSGRSKQLKGKRHRGGTEVAIPRAAVFNGRIWRNDESEREDPELPAYSPRAINELVRPGAIASARNPRKTLVDVEN